MATTTTRLGLRKPNFAGGGDNINGPLDLNANWDKIDSIAGFTVCTSGTRPTAFQGQCIYETDTGKAYICTVAPSTFVQLHLGTAAYNALATFAAGIAVTGTATVSSTATASDFVIATGSRSVTSELDALNAFPAGMTKISENILGSAAASVTFSSIPATYRSLQLHVTGRGDTAATFVSGFLRFNGDSGANYDFEQMIGNAAVASAAEALAQTSLSVAEFSAASAPSGQAGSIVVNIPFYRQTVFWKNALTSHQLNVSNASGGVYAKMLAGRWRNTAAINSILIGLSAGNFITGSSFVLYGLR